MRAEVERQTHSFCGVVVYLGHRYYAPTTRDTYEEALDDAKRGKVAAQTRRMHSMHVLLTWENGGLDTDDWLAKAREKRSYKTIWAVTGESG